jgi:hypothetical protein
VKYLVDIRSKAWLNLCWGIDKWKIVCSAIHPSRQRSVLLYVFSWWIHSPRVSKAVTQHLSALFCYALFILL